MDRPVKYSFVPKKRDIITNSFEKPAEVKFYQMAMYKADNGRYHVRRIVYDEDNRIKEVKTSYLTKDKIQDFVEKRRSNSYKIYPVYSLDTVTYPSSADITLARSVILSADYNYTGYSPYYC